MLEETGTSKVYDIAEKDALQIHTDGEKSGDNLETNMRRSNRNIKKPTKYSSIPYTGNFWGNRCCIYILQVICGVELKKLHNRKRFRSLHTSYPEKPRHQTENEEEKKKEGEVSYSVHCDTWSLPSFASQTVYCLET